MPSSKPDTEFIAEMDRYQFNIDKNRVGKDDKPAIYENKNFGWNMMLPGYWLKSNTPGLSMESFNDPRSGAVVIVESVAKDAGNNTASDVEKFDSMKMVTGKGISPEKVDTIQVKGKNVKVYKYRLEDDSTETYADVYFYIIDGESTHTAS